MEQIVPNLDKSYLRKHYIKSGLIMRSEINTKPVSQYKLNN